MEMAGRVARPEAVRLRAVGFLETCVAQTDVAMKFGFHRTTVVVGGNVTVGGNAN